MLRLGGPGALPRHLFGLLPLPRQLRVRRFIKARAALSASLAFKTHLFEVRLGLVEFRGFFVERGSSVKGLRVDSVPRQGASPALLRAWSLFWSFVQHSAMFTCKSTFIFLVFAASSGPKSYSLSFDA